MKVEEKNTKDNCRVFRQVRFFRKYMYIDAYKIEISWTFRPKSWLCIRFPVAVAYNCSRTPWHCRARSIRRTSGRPECWHRLELSITKLCPGSKSRFWVFFYNSHAKSNRFRQGFVILSDFVFKKSGHIGPKSPEAGVGAGLSPKSHLRASLTVAMERRPSVDRGDGSPSNSAFGSPLELRVGGPHIPGTPASGYKKTD